MKYVVVYKLENEKAAFAFDSYNDAVDYINKCSDYADEYSTEISSISDNSYEMILKNGKNIKITIDEYSDSKVKYDLVYQKNGRHVETRRFTKRKLAVDFANKIIEELDCTVDENENEFGEWIVDDPENNIKARVGLNLIIVGEKETSDYEILGVKSTASPDEIKQAFRKMAIKYHPDQGGDSEMFQKVHEAYERISGGSSKSGRQKIVKSYNSMDMRYFFKNFSKLEDKMKAEVEKNLEPILAEVRSKASGLVVRGIVEALIGGALTSMSYNAASAGGTYVIFSGLIIIGIWNFFKGLYYLANPKALLKKLK